MHEVCSGQVMSMSRQVLGRAVQLSTPGLVVCPAAVAPTPSHCFHLLVEHLQGFPECPVPVFLFEQCSGALCQNPLRGLPQLMCAAEAVCGTDTLLKLPCPFWYFLDTYTLCTCACARRKLFDNILQLLHHILRV